MRPEKHANTTKTALVEEEYNDICATCNHLKICVNQHKRIRPVWFCEEFDDYVPAEKIKVKIPVQKSKPKDKYQISSDKKNTQSQTLKGLCVDCENRDNCSLKKTNGGVWHCEEYK